MDDLDMLARDFGFGPRGKSNPMRSDQADRSRPVARSSFDDPLFNDVFGGPSKFSSSLNSNANSNDKSDMSDFDYDSIFKSSEPKNNNSSSKKSSLPVYDKPVYDDDIFDGLPGLKSKPASTAVMFDTDSFATSKSKNHRADFDDLLGNLGRNEKVGQSNKSSTAKKTSASESFDDLLGGFGSNSSATGDRSIPESTWGSAPAAGSKQRPSVANVPFVALESTSAKGSSSSRLVDQPEEINKTEKSRSTNAEVSSGSGKAFDDLDPLNNFGNSLHSYSTEREIRMKDVSPSRSTKPQSVTAREQKENSTFGYSESNMENQVPFDRFQEPPLFDVPSASADFQKYYGQTASSPIYDESGADVDMSYSSSGQIHQSDEIWLTVSEIPLFTQPTNAPPPSRPPPPIPRQTSRTETTYFPSSSNKKDGDFFSPPSYSQSPRSPKFTPSTVQGKTVSQFDELEDFAKGLSRNSIDESTSFYSNEETNTFSAAAASAAAMKDAMDKAEAKFRYAKEVREREYAKFAKNKDSMQMEKEEQDWQDGELRETQERVNYERKQKEEEEREKRRLEKERETEREKERQAVERVTREARERAAAEARERAASEARLKTERAAVQRAQAEARERAAAEAKERAEKAAAEARERVSAAEAKERAERAAAAEARERVAAAETRERAERAAAEVREKEAAIKAKAEVEARRRAERAAFERAAAEARERAAADARERAAAAAKANQRKNDDDLDSFFGMGRASSAPRARENSTEPMFNQQFPNKGASEATKRPSSGVSSNIKRASSTTNIIDDLSSIFGASPSAGEFQEVEGETVERRRARLERHQRTQERAAKALAEKNMRDVQAQRDQEERHRAGETLDIEIRRWSAGKEGNLRALLSTLQYVLWPECGWQPVSLTDLITGASVKKVYRKATLCIHPDKVQQKGATLQQKYIAEKVFDLLKEAWNKFNSEELF